MVMRIELMIGWLVGQDVRSDDDILITIDIVVPPIPLLGTSSEDMYDGLHHGVTKSIRAMVKQVADTGYHKWDLREYDGAAANDRLNWFLVRRNKAQGRLSHGSGCGNHATVLVQSDIMCVANVCPVVDKKMNLLGDYYCSTLFARMGGLFLKMVVVSDVVVRKHVRLVPGEPPEGADLYSAEAIDYMISTWRYNRPQNRDAPSEKSFHGYSKKMKVFFQLFNGGGGIQDGLPHYTRSARAARVDKKVLTDQMTKSIKEIVLPSMPVVP
eukprot:6167634-Karenia_brevis.AAC.1